MKSIISKIVSLVRNFVWFLKGLGTKQKWVAGVIGAVIVFGVGYAIFGPGPSHDDSMVTTEIRSVSLIPVSVSTEDSTSSGTAGSETVVRAETAGKITEVRPIGSRITSGATIAVFENASQRAALLQAEGSLEAAEAGLTKVQGGLRSEKIATLEAAFESAQNGAVATLLAAYGTVDSAIRDTADQMYSAPESSIPQLNFSSSNSQRRTELENERVVLNSVLSRENSVSVSLSSNSDLESELSKTESELRQVRTFIDTLIAALNEAIPTSSVGQSTINTYKASATAARTALTSSLSAIASTRAGIETAENNLDEALAGAEDADVAAAAASVKQARGAYEAALASYQKTIVRSPASGTIVSCNAAVGDVLSIGNDVCRIKTVSGSFGNSFTLPLSSVKYTPGGAFVFVVNEEGVLEALQVETGLVSADGIVVSGLLGDEYVVRDVRGLKPGQKVTIE